MKIDILDIFKENGATCFLCKTTLEDYLGNLPEDYRGFFIQRGIVANKFLDNIADTLINHLHIPIMVLIGGPDAPKVNVGDTFQLEAPFRVLDGLQRTHRLRELREAADYIDNRFQDDLELSPAKAARKASGDLKDLEISSSAFQKMLTVYRSGRQLRSLFTDYEIRLEIWFSLTESEQIRKMLILNAGHKSVNIKHQIELLFWSDFADFQKALTPAKILREREKGSIAYSKNREPGEFHFSQLIAAFVSLTEGGAISTNADYSARKTFDESRTAEDGLVDVNEKVLHAFANTLKSLDAAFSSAAEVRWLGREVVLVGVFGAIGDFAHKNKISYEDVLESFAGRVPEFTDYINLSGFEEQRNSVDLSKVNIGNVNKQAVFAATSLFLKCQHDPIADWATLFEPEPRQ